MKNSKIPTDFQGILVAEEPNLYLRAAIKRAERQKKPNEDSFSSHKAHALGHTSLINDVITRRLTILVKSFPSLERLSPLLKELIELEVGTDDLRNALGRVYGVPPVLRRLMIQTNARIRNARNVSVLRKELTSFHGRCSSVLNSIESSLKFLRSARLILREMPQLRNMPTIAVVGYPNVGKSTLFCYLTGSKVDIAPYAFTTKRINVGHMETVQIIDTPGTLNRPGQRNRYEQTVDIALAHASDAALFVYDPTGSSAPPDEQEKLLKQIQNLGRPVVVFLSKIDLITHAERESMEKEFSAYSDKEILKKKLLELF